MDDLISRQAAIDAVRHAWAKGLEPTQYLEELPSAQPEIVRCKDCRWGREKLGNIECFADINVPSEYHGYDWFCPNGEREDNG